MQGEALVPHSAMIVADSASQSMTCAVKTLKACGNLHEANLLDESL